jgi:hypothetical protein
LDDGGRNDRGQAVHSPACNVLARVCVVAVAFAASAFLHVGSGQAAGDTSAGDFSAQIDGIVSSALGVAQQPLNDGSATAESVVNQAVALADKAGADAAATAAPLAPLSAAEAAPMSVEALPSNSEVPAARERAAPARPRPALKRKRPRTAVSRAKTTPVASSAWYQVSPSAAGPSPVARMRTAKAPPRPERSAAPAWPLPSWPMPPRPDASSSGLSGGQSTPIPSLLAALTGLLLIFGFHFLPRLLPLPAFRKPRRIVLPSWHPG